MVVHLVLAIPGLTTDWLWLSREDGLSVRLQRELTEAKNTVMLSGTLVWPMILIDADRI